MRRDEERGGTCAYSRFLAEVVEPRTERLTSTTSSVRSFLRVQSTSPDDLRKMPQERRKESQRYLSRQMNSCPVSSDGGGCRQRQVTEARASLQDVHLDQRGRRREWREKSVAKDESRHSDAFPADDALATRDVSAREAGLCCDRLGFAPSVLVSDHVGCNSPGLPMPSRAFHMRI